MSAPSRASQVIAQQQSAPGLLPNRTLVRDYGRRIRRAAVLGSGVMGAQIAAHLANVGVSVLLFELPAAEDDKNANVVKALKGLTRLKPSPLATLSTQESIQAANYDQHLPELQHCDLVIEAITERLDWKQDLYRMVAPHLNEHTILATNTSGIGINKLAEALPDALKERFCAVHFFNPPRYMHLLEVIPHRDAQPELMETLLGFLTTTLGKGVVEAKDTPGFIGNRVGVFSILTVLHHAERLGLPLDLVDKLTGPGIGRPKSATFRTADVVGLDTFAHVVNTLAQNLRDDPWHGSYRLPDWVQTLIEKGALGQKTRAGVYTKVGKEIHVLDPKLSNYRRVRSALDDDVRKILLNRDIAQKYEALHACRHPQADFLLSIHLDLFHFCAFHLQEIAHSARDIDLAMRWGYAWQRGPFEIWQAAGWQKIAKLITEKIAGGEMMSAVSLPQWAIDKERVGVHGTKGSWSADEDRVIPRSDHAVFRRQAFPERLLGESKPTTATVFETDAVRLWHQNDGVAVLSFKTKMHTISEAVLDGILQAVETAEGEFKGLVLWHTEAPFSAGANLREATSAVQAGNFDVVEAVVKKFQQASMALKHSYVPTVAGVQGLALGGGCEFLLHCDRVVAALESYIGLVEVGVGLVPAGGGCKELVIRAADEAKGGDLFPFVARYFERVAMGRVSGSAAEAMQWGYLRQADKVVFNPHEALHVARQEALALYEAGYRPPQRRQSIPVAGSAAMATLQAQLVNLLKGGFISAHDYEIGQRLASILCGGDIDPGSVVDDEWLLRLEVEAFMGLLKTDNTQARIEHMLKTGKPLRN